MILCEWDASEGHPGQSCVHMYARILSTSFTSVSIFSVWCYSSVSISMVVTITYKVAVYAPAERADIFISTPHMYSVENGPRERERWFRDRCLHPKKTSFKYDMF